VPKTLPQPVQLAPLATLLNALRPLAQTLIWLALTWLALLVARAAHRPSHLIEIAVSLADRMDREFGFCRWRRRALAGRG
jgi:hypothetical protein